METDDDNLLGGGDTDIPTKTAENLKRTAKPVEQLSSQGEEARKRRARARLPEEELLLSTPGLLGLSSRAA